MGHVLGELLYKKEGMGALEICDDRFGFACFHQVAIEAIRERGEGVISSLSSVCSVANGGLCIHGIGHGILEYYGSDDQGLRRGLQACADFLDPVYGGNCADGVFMEYQGVLFGGEESPRTIEGTDSFRMCDTAVPLRFKNECFRSLGRWWISYYRDVGRGEEVCAAVPAQYQSSCYFGIGSYFPLIMNFEAERVYAACADLLAVSARSFCTSGARLQMSIQSKEIREPNVKIRTDD
jgi:hypothetical protein